MRGATEAKVVSGGCVLLMSSQHWHMKATELTDASNSAGGMAMVWRVCREYTRRTLRGVL